MNPTEASPGVGEFLRANVSAMNNQSSIFAFVVYGATGIVTEFFRGLDIKESDEAASGSRVDDVTVFV